MSKNDSFFMDKKICPVYENNVCNCYLFDTLGLLHSLSNDSVQVIVSDVLHTLTSKYELPNSKYSGRILGFTSEYETKQKDELFTQFTETLPLLNRILKKGGSCYIFIDKEYSKKLWETAQRTNFKFQRLVNEDESVYSRYASHFNIIRLSKDEGIPHTTTYDNHNVLVTSDVELTDEPMEILTSLIKSNSKINDVIVDVSAGAGYGVVWLSAYSTGRQFVGIETNKDYLNLAIHKIKTVLEPYDFNTILNKFKI